MHFETNKHEQKEQKHTRTAQADLFAEGLPYLGWLTLSWAAWLCMCNRQQEKDNLLKNNLKNKSIVPFLSSFFCCL